MSALKFAKVPADRTRNCILHGCVARGRWQPVIASYVVPDTGLCSKHRKYWEITWNEAKDAERG